MLLKDEAELNAKGKMTYSYEIEDGQQRLTTLFSFLNDEYQLHSSTPEVELDGTVYDLAGLKYSELSEECQDAIKNYRFSVQCLENYTMEEAETLFFNINSGVALSTIQKSKSKLGTELISFFNELLDSDFFTQYINITNRQALSEDDLLMLLQSSLLIDSRFDGYEFKNLSAASCLKYAQEIRNNFDEEHKSMLKDTVKYLSEAFDEKRKYLRKNNVPIIAVNAVVAQYYSIAASDFGEFIDSFFEDVPEDYKLASGASNIKIHKVIPRLLALYKSGVPINLWYLHSYFSLV